MAIIDDSGSQQFFDGTKADLKPGDLIEAGRTSNFGNRKKAVYVYLTATLDAATWGAELALGDGPGRIYIVEPTGPIPGQTTSRSSQRRGSRPSRTEPACALDRLLLGKTVSTSRRCAPRE